MPARSGVTAALLLLALLSATLPAGDWPQILGPNRDGVAAPDERLADRWPDAGPPVLWNLAVGRGFAGPAVVGNTLLLLDRLQNQERLQALDTANGHPTWTQTWPTNFVPQYGRDDGPLCVPTVADGAVIAFGAQGVLSCFDLASGDVRWRHDTATEFDALEGFFGAGSSPLVDDGKVIVNIGGKSQQAGIVAFDLATGQVLWKSVDDGASYASPVAATIGGRRRILALTRLKCVLIDPANGNVAAELPYGLRGPTVTAANPLVLMDRLFLSASYGIGARFVSLADDRLHVLWDTDDLMSSQYTTCIVHDGLLYGVDGRQDIPPATLKCFDPATQKVLWSEPDFGYATLIKADSKLVIMKTDGELVIAPLSRDAYRRLATARLFHDTVRALPALADGRLYVRDGRTLKCVDLRPQP